MIFVSLLALPAFAQSVTKVALNDVTVVSGMPTTGTVTLSAPAPTGGYKVTMLYGPYGLGPATLTVPASQTTATFKLTAKTVSTNRTETVMAQGTDNSSATTSCVVIPPTVQKLEMSAPFVMAGQSATATLTLTGIPVTSGLIVNLTSSDPNFTVPDSVTVPWPSQFVTFPVNAVGGTNSIKSTVITATYGKDKVTTTLTAIPYNLPQGLKPGVYQCLVETKNDSFMNYLSGLGSFGPGVPYFSLTLTVQSNGTICINLNSPNTEGVGLLAGLIDNKSYDQQKHDAALDCLGNFFCPPNPSVLWSYAQVTLKQGRRLVTFCGNVKFSGDGSLSLTLGDFYYNVSNGQLQPSKGSLTGTYTLRPIY